MDAFTRARARTRDRLFRRALLVADALAAVVALSACVASGAGRLTPALLLGVPLVLAGAKLHGLYDRDELVIRKGTIEDSPRLVQLAAALTIATWVLDDQLLRGPLQASQGLVLLVAFWAPPC